MTRRCTITGPAGPHCIEGPFTKTCLQCGRPMLSTAETPRRVDDNDERPPTQTETFVDQVNHARPGGYRRLGAVSPDRPDRRDELDPTDPDPEDNL